MIGFAEVSEAIGVFGVEVIQLTIWSKRVVYPVTNSVAKF